MATPTTNTVPASAIDRNATAVPWLVWDQKWGAGPLGEGVTLSYSFSANASRFIDQYGNGEIDEPSGLRLLSTHEKSAIVQGMAAWSLVAEITFVFTQETDTNVGDIRFGKTDFSPGTTAHAYLPENAPEAGDVWFKASTWTDALTPGTFDFYVILHEIGHALGLEHTFTEPLIAPAQFDNHLYSVMAYKQGPQSIPNGAFGSFYPTTPMFYDILAMQSLYGANLTAHLGDTIYVYTEGTEYFETIFDTGGNDTIRYDGAQGVTISLVVGAFSSLSAMIFFDVGSSKETVCIGPSTIIENAIGGEGDDRFFGNSANNLIDGRGGADVMRGAVGNDTYVVNTAGDLVIEYSGGGADTVRTSIAYVLPSNVENLVLIGAGASSLTGNALANTLTGNDQNNSLDGKTGADTLRGGGGNDIYIVDNFGDVVSEAGGSGRDLVKTSVSFTLGGDVESVQLTGAAKTGIGNALANALIGSAGANQLNGMAGDDRINGGDGDDALNGGLGSDVLIGGAGVDKFVFNTALGASNRDVVTDFNVAEDTIRLENAIFVGLAQGQLAATAFRIGAAAADANDRIIYNSANGALLFDVDGAGGAAAIQFATLSAGLALTQADFQIV